MRAHRNHSTSSPLRLSLFTAGLLLLLLTRPAFAVEAQKPQPSLADTIQQQGTIPREQFYGEVKLLHAPNPMDVQFSEDGSVLFSQAETIRLWRSDNGDYLGSIAGPTRFRQFAQLNHSRWLVTVDDLEDVWLSHGLHIIPQAVPCLRVWDVTTGTCLGTRRLKIPVNAAKIWFPDLETADQSQTTYVIIRYSDEQHNDQRLLAGFHGSELVPTFQFVLTEDFDALTWDAQARQLYLYGDSFIAALNPVSNKISWSTKVDQLDNAHFRIDSVTTVDKPSELNQEVSDRLILLASRPAPDAATEKDILLQWKLIAASSGHCVKSGVVTRDLKTPDTKNDSQKSGKLIYWLCDDTDHTIKAINLFDNKLELLISHGPANTAASSRHAAKFQKWYLEREDFRAGTFKVVNSRKANRVCSMSGDREEIELYHSNSGKSVASASGTVNSLSRISADQISAAFDWNEACIFELNDSRKLNRTFHTQVPQNSCVALSADASILLAGDAAGRVHLWNLPQQAETAILSGGTQKLFRIAVSSALNRIMAVDSAGTFWWWPLPVQSNSVTNRSQTVRPAGSASPTVPTISFDLKNFSSPYHLPTSLCDLSGNGSQVLCFKPCTPVLDLHGESHLTPGFSFLARGVVSVDPQLGIVISTDNNLKSKRLTPAVSEKTVLLQLKLSTDGRYALFVFDTGQVTIVDIQENTLQSIIQTNNREIMDVDYHHDRKTLLVASFRGTVTAWNSEAFLKTGSLQLTDARLNLLSSRPAPDGFDLVLGTWDTGLIVKRNAFPTAKQKPQRPAALTYPFK